ncbi:unnamed protein product [Lupinus luteus]|uniref:Uncharacterized protein n=1 Tax=Lupinus luteus TaxID=3873 RepID=A0AAV1VUT8_LUPLU
MNSLGSGPPIVGRNGTFSGSVPQPGFRSGTFAPGPNHAYSRQNSAVDKFARTAVMKKHFKNYKKWCKYLDWKSSLW